MTVFESCGPILLVRMAGDDTHPVRACHDWEVICGNAPVGGARRAEHAVHAHALRFYRVLRPQRGQCVRLSASGRPAPRTGLLPAPCAVSLPLVVASVAASHSGRCVCAVVALGLDGLQLIDRNIKCAAVAGAGALRLRFAFTTAPGLAISPTA